MNYWFIIHSLAAYQLHNDLIGCKVKYAGSGKPRFKEFSQIKKGDRIVYYASKSKLVIGIFEVVSDISRLANDPHWKEMFVYRIRPVEMPPNDLFLDFKKALLDSSRELELFPNAKYWYSYLQGKTCRRLTKKDYRMIAGWLKKPKYLVGPTDKITL